MKTYASGSAAKPTPIFKTDLVWLGVPLPALIMFVNWYALQRCQVAEWEGWPVHATYGLFVFEVAALSHVVGARMTAQPLWWLIFFWGVVLVDLQLATIVMMNRTLNWGTSWAEALGYSLLSAQIGFAAICGILSVIAWHIRLPLSAFALAVLVYVGWTIGNSQWAAVILYQTVGTLIVAVVLRLFRFQIGVPLKPGDDANAGGSQLQFSIRHLFYWTTVTAIVVTLGRWIGWRTMAYYAGLVSVTILTPIFTTISMLAVWGALGRERWFIRFPVVLMGLAASGTLLNWFATPQQRVWQRIHPSHLTAGGASGWWVFVFWIVWACLAGLFLTGLVMVFRAAGSRLQRATRGLSSGKARNS